MRHCRGAAYLNNSAALVNSAVHIELDLKQCGQSDMPQSLAVISSFAASIMVRLIELASLDEQETLIEVLHQRFIAHRRAKLVKEIQNAQQEYQEGLCQAATPSEIIKEILF